MRCSERYLKGEARVVRSVSDGEYCTIYVDQWADPHCQSGKFKLKMKKSTGDYNIATGKKGDHYEPDFGKIVQDDEV